MINSFKSFAQDIKFQHTIFALPFAVAAIIFAGIDVPSAAQVVLLLICMITARSFAMGANRYIDRQIDLKNPRTQNRAIPSGRLKPWQMAFWTIIFGALFVLAAFLLSELAGWLSFPVLLFLGLYPYWKRIHFFAHWYLGLCLGLAPCAVIVALTGEWPPTSVIAVGLGVALWTGGFDVIYSLQDRDFDVANRLKSAPAVAGVKHSLNLSRASFVVSLALFAYAGWLIKLNWLYFLGVGFIAAILFAEHFLVRNERSRKKYMNLAFFNANASVSLVFLGFSLLGLL